MADKPSPPPSAVDRHEAERRHTEDLVAGFDKPARTPHRSGRSPDFVDYHSGKDRSSFGSSGEPPVLESEPGTTPAGVPRRRPMPPWIAWVSLSLLLFGFGIAVALLVIAPEPAKLRTPSATTTISAASAPLDRVDREGEIPPPPAATPAPEPVAASAPPKPRVPAPPSASVEKRLPPRDDYFRDF